MNDYEDSAPVRGVTLQQIDAERRRLEALKRQPTTPGDVAARAAKLPPPRREDEPPFRSLTWQG